MATALVFLFEGFEEIETVSPIDILRRAEVDVVVASISDTLLVKGRSNLLLQADVLLSSIPADRVFDCVVVPGGPGTKLLRESPTVLSIVKRHDYHRFANVWLGSSDLLFSQAC
jgi:4-methyl-5(b-hydroxyethyl)-thiazole monophosphate biosynthesis